MRTKTKTINILLFIFILLGSLLAAINFFHDRSLWLDEAYLALNIANKPLKELLIPLDYNQVAPIGFLVIEKAFSAAFSNTDWSLRIFPMLLFFSSIYFMYQVSFRTFKEKSFALFAAAFFCLSYYPMYYSSEVKQYMVDIFICLIVILFSLRFSTKNINNIWWQYGLVGIISVWFSNISVILLFSIGLFLLFNNRGKKENYLAIIAIISLWVFSFATYYVLFIHNHPSKQFMIDFWSNVNAFLPENILSKAFIQALYSKIVEVYKLFHYKLQIVFVLISILGLFFLIKKKSTSFIFLLLPLITHLVLSYFKLYPFHGRLILYQYPILILLIVSCIYHLYSLLKPKIQQLALYLLLIPLILNIINLFHGNNFPFEKEEIKKSMTHLKMTLKDDELIYIHRRAFPAFLYYSSNYSRFRFFKNSDIMVCQSCTNKQIISVSDIEGINANVWILFSHNDNKKNRDEEKFILALFKKNNFEIVEEYKYQGSSIYKAVKLE
ncbi:glycosyltransferase family 39 protein [uncultured Draconibacterium sp.]|uniref:glycosyltransferase family 39 protein n=1 Tax=uncultured Draconibacterium sp. TaxID=1573823 RepID=UPI002AA61162|nr:glycosyltransferase family 39 protein [uncultured Draconibacterium sp.]